MERTLSRSLRGVFLQNLWRDLYKLVGNHQQSFETEAELRLTELMTSPGFDSAKAKLGQYLQEATKLREKKQYEDALIIVLVSGEYYWRQHEPTRAAGLLLEASDLFYLAQKPDASNNCLRAAFDLMAPRAQLSWWERELIGSIFLLVACLSIIVDSNSLKTQLNSFYGFLSPKQQARLRREDGYRIVIALRRAITRKSLTPIEDLDSKAPLRSRSDYSTLYEHLQGISERYVIIHDGLIALQNETQSEGG
jgi:hypothetical protein